MLSGNGGTETSRLVGMLDLPNLSIGKTAFPLIESELAKYIIPYTQEILAVNLVKEVRLHAAKVGFDFDAWHNQRSRNTELIDISLLPLLTIAYDMAWQKRSSRHRYDSHSGHAIPIGVLSNLPIGLAILNKHCRVCASSKETIEHDCMTNFEGSNGSMESAALVQLAHSLLDEKHVFFGTIVGDDDSSMRAHMKWSNSDWMINNDTTEPPRVASKSGALKVRPDRGELRREYPEPSWLNDPSHRGKTLSGELRALEKQPLAVSKGVNKVDCIKL
jgi:hypothetical protein